MFVNVCLCVCVCVFVCVCVYLSVRDIETSTIRLPSSDLAVAKQKNRNFAYLNICLLSEGILYFVPCNFHVCTK